MKNNNLIISILLLFFSFVQMNDMKAQSPDQNISGIVLDANKEPIIGATVMVKGTNKGVVTDEKGVFKLKATKGQTLSVSYLGYKEKTIPVTKDTYYKILMNDESVDLDEIVVIGYGTAMKSDLTGSISSMGADKLMKTGAASFAQGMQGHLAGVKVTTQSGEAGAGVDIIIRGSNSLNAGTSPLYVIDGMQIDIHESEVATSSIGGQTTYNPLASINSNDIASINVLKDASATAIYGARGANGVIIITTKSGQSANRTDINFNASIGISKIANKYDVLDGQEYINMKFARGSNDMDIWGRDYGDGLGLVPRNVETENLATYNWQDELTRTGMMQNYDIAMNTIIKKTRIASSLGYYSQKGVIDSNGFNRYSGRLKIDHEISKKWNTGISFTLGRVDNKGAMSSGGTSGTGGYTGIVQLMYTERPVELYTTSELTGEFAEGYVPLSSMTSSETYKKTIFDRVLANAYLQFTPIKELRFKLNGSFTTTNSKLSEFYSSKSRWGHGTDGRSVIEQINTLSYTLTGTGEYSKKINNDNQIDFLLGAEINSYHPESSYFRVDNYEDQSTGVFNISKGQTVNSYKSSASAVNRASVFGRINYNFKNRYLLTANMRVDASSNFAKEHRTGYFPSAALAWKVNKEEFMKDITFVNNLKLRASAGITGNDRISNYSYLSTLSTAYYASNNSLLFGQCVNSPDNSKLKWETTYQYDLGLDLSVLDNRISLSTDIYLKDTRDMLYNANIPSQSGFPKQWKNLGRMTNKGLEITLNTQNIIKRNFSWSTNFNFDMNRTQLISLGGDEEYFPVSLNYGAFTDVGRVIVGKPIGLIYGYECDGNYQVKDFNWTDKQTGVSVDPADVNSSNISALNYTLREDVVAYNGMNVHPGDRKYKDITGDNIIDPNDRKVIGDTNPKFNFGFGNDFTIGKFDISLFLEGSYGGKILNAFKRMIEPGLNNINNNVLKKSFYERWTPENASNTYPRLLNALDQQVSSYFVEDGSYLRIKNLSVGYTINNNGLKSIGINNIRLSFMVDNLYTFTNYSGLDPEVRSYEKFLRGMDQTAYPRTRNFIFGVNMSL